MIAMRGTVHRGDSGPLQRTIGALLTARRSETQILGLPKGPKAPDLKCSVA